MDTTLTRERIRHSTERGFWRNESLETYLDRWATRRPDKSAVVDGRSRHTYAELARLVERVAHGLRAHGVAPGSVISCQLPNWNECIVLFLAAARLSKGLSYKTALDGYGAVEVGFCSFKLTQIPLQNGQVPVGRGTFRFQDHIAVGLPQLASQLEAEAHWNRMLSLGEQQRLGLARALLLAPQYLFLDEATASLDEASEAALYHLLKEKLPATTIISIGHRSTLQAFHQRHVVLARDGDRFTLHDRSEHAKPL